MNTNIVFDYYPRGLPDEDMRTGIHTLLSTCFSRERMTDKEKEQHDDKFCSGDDKMGYAVATVNGKVVGVAIAYKRTINFRGQSLVLGGVGGVCTKEEFRRQGIATRLVKVVMEKLREEGCDMAYLCTNIEKYGGLYGASGFEKLNKEYTYLGESGKRYYDSGGMIAPVNSPEVFKEVSFSDSSFDIGTGDW